MPEVIMPKMGDAMEEGTLLQWLKQDGETVKSGDVIAEIETDKSNVEIEAEDSGVLHIQAQPGAVVPVGKAIAMIGDDVKPNVQTEKTRESAAEYDTPSAAAIQPPPRMILGGAGKNGGNGTNRLKASPLARSVARQRGIDIAKIMEPGRRAALSKPTFWHLPARYLLRLPRIRAGRLSRLLHHYGRGGQSPKPNCPPCGK